MLKYILVPLGAVLILGFAVARSHPGVLLLLTGRQSSLISEGPPATGTSSPFTVQDVQVGDPQANYANVEVVDNYPYMVWIEQKGGISGAIWHCGIDPATGDLIPKDCRGFKAFDSNLLNRANIGADSKGLYYVGADPQGHIKLVRPTGPTAGTVTTLPTPPDARRRAYYASLTPGSDKQYISWTLNSSTPGITNATGGGGNAWVELQYIDVADPTNIHTIEHQDIKGRIAPMDASVARWVDGEPAIVYEAYSSGGYDLKEYDVSTNASHFITDDGRPKVDEYPFVFDGTEAVPTSFGANRGEVLTRPAGSSAILNSVQSITVPVETTLKKPGSLVSFQPIVFRDKAYAAYQINDASYAAPGRNSYLRSLAQPGEIWLTTILAGHNQEWLVSGPEQLVRTEPEPFTGTHTAWVFYSAAALGAKSPFMTHWQLRRAATPISQ